MIRVVLLFMLLTCLTSIDLLTQDYQPFKEGSISFFSNLQGLRVDSVKQSSEGKEYYFQKSWDFLDYEGSYFYTLKPTGPSWLGHKCLVKNDGSMLFIIENRDTCVLKPFNPIGQYWTVDQYIDTDGKKYTINASVVERTYKKFLDFQDTVIVMKLKIYLNGKEVHSANLSGVELSKNYGFVTMFNFYNFTKDSDKSYNDYTKTYSLVGLTSPQSGKTFLTPRQIYNFDVGDEFHYYSENADLPELIQTKTKTIKKVVGKSVSDDKDTIVYIYDVNRQIQSPIYGDPERDSIYKGLETQKFIFDKKFYLPYEPFFYSNNETYVNYSYCYPNSSYFGGFDYYYTLSYDSLGRLVCSTQENGEVFSPNGNNTWELLFIHKANEGVCKEGLGFTYYGYTDMFEWSFEELVYFKKGSEEWGKPIIITSVMEESVDKFLVSPNPANGEIRLSRYGNVEIFDLQGNLLIKIGYLPADSNINISELTEGTYIIKLKNEFGELTEKFVVTR